MSWFAEEHKAEKCSGCEARDAHIKTLHEIVVKLTEERDADRKEYHKLVGAERAEFKRAIDSLLNQAKATPLGVGTSEFSPDAAIADPVKYLSYLEEATKDEA